TTNLCSAAVNPGTASATDNVLVSSMVGVRSDALALNAPYPAGCPHVTTITWTATDCAGHSSSCPQAVTVHDTQAPNLVTPGNLTLGCGDLTDPPATGTATATDNCTASPSVTYSDNRAGLIGC